MTAFDFIATRNEIIEAAFRIVGAVPLGDPISADMMGQGVAALQLLIKSWNNKHHFPSEFRQTTFPTIAAQAVYDATLDQSIIGLYKAWYIDSTSLSEYPIEVVSESRYRDLQIDATATGRPLAIAFRQTPAPRFSLWPIPDAIFTVRVQCLFSLEDLDGADDTGDLMVQWQRALKYALAEDLMDEYPPETVTRQQYIQNKAATLFSEAKHRDAPVETTNEIAGLYPNKC